MKNLTANPKTLRNLSALAVMMLGLLLWIPQGWAATIHSTAAGGDWNKAETWVGGQVPTENDRVVVNGVVNVTGATVKEVVISTGAILQSHGTSSDTLTVNGDITNNGIIKNADNGTRFYIKVSGNLINNGKWDNFRTTLTKGIQTITISGNPLSSRVVFYKDFSITDNSFTFAGNVNFNGHKITLPTSGKIIALKQVIGSVNIEGENTTLIFQNNSGESQRIDSTYNVNTVILAGAGKKEVLAPTINGSVIVKKEVIIQVLGATINGSLIVEKEAILQNYGSSCWCTLTVNGDITNNGIIKNGHERGYFYINVSGNILNNGIWNNYHTTLTFPSGEFRMTGTPTWEKPYRGSSYEITDYLTTQHHWQVSVDGGPWSE
ncbi:MAG: hypothetical protein VSS75_019340 [Candidatus Parabeggiatoa sp.]|nr:hypothetical protein [Candidatus Parabeggiatoa sp.]